MSPKHPLPNFFILGAAKAGTTSIYQALKLHPEIFLSFDKEPMFFARDDYFQRGTNWYAGAFFSEANGFKLRGEATPHYLYWAEKVARRMLDTYFKDELRFIVSLRNPVERAYSWYWNMVKVGRENLDFKGAIAQEAARLQDNNEDLFASGSMKYGYFKGGCYADQLEAFFNVFPPENFAIVLQEDLFRDFAGTIQGLFAFLGVEQSLPVKRLNMNPSSQPRSRNVQHVLREPSRVKDVVKALLPFPLRYRLKRKLGELNRKPFDYPEMDKEIAALLTNRYREQIIRLQDLIEVDLSNWLAAEE